jgi:hypothetical protein
MVRFITIDGCDNSLKTSVINRIIGWAKSLDRHNIKVLKFPSAEIFKTDIAKRLFGDGDETARGEFIDLIIGETERELGAVIKQRQEDPNSIDEHVLIDRLFISTLVYHGSGYSGNYELEQVITQKYDAMFERLGIHPGDVWHYVSVYPLKTCDKGETEPLKLKLDAKADLYVKKTEEVLYGIISGKIRSPYLTNIQEFVEGREEYTRKTQLTDEELDVIGTARANEIIYVHFFGPDL